MSNDVSPASYHYALIARALEIIDREGELPLETLAAQLGLSPAHFQRTFSRWVGVSPKRYQQYLALGHARRLLAERFTVLDTALASGLSGPSRLHDLFMSWEAMSPGDYARGGAGLTIRHAFTDSPFGETLVMATERGLCGLAFVEETGRGAAMADMTSRWPKAHFQADDSVAALLSPVFGGTGETRLHLIGAPFQIKVWEALMQIPTGHVTTYGEIARAIGSPKANRAVGAAVGRNPISWIIPCHRAISSTGQLTGYHWGLPVKRAMLAWESARIDASIA
ncbi:6-O-methylguanine DNA methyltransferase [Haematobacter massiliensis]|uniref:methylated-DNA--[protein]-cysteine S-methyltransferase n=1 Tax=Haematobacter massiliensis TaxID=195105 RepID=A0A086YCD6_9RHOB|nr:bifunctional helix-turn-helix domain-containing protein/methylated-DNA--[protein]-cysteine S-methyltransferase [Haematobacter massiliensis]KFI31936.1 6-O-methylguanine DNA methyltransferase [Haematobacter massiliensis]OWJ72553.1 6-O-methylguanine DNA methyltransferase [Haematobacter massiliensis]OWJ87891.1 6-O-methylguanine DNA methyltransferase [Haematobacter massiliensis]QBJ24330.1 methylated-DNA--[protein]-cysteine S-methyltransferase [Haematobacter massiliensis]